MGQEITSSHFAPRDFEMFAERLLHETNQLANWIEEGRFAPSHHVGGFELEAWLLNENAKPAPINQSILEQLNHSLVVSELAKFNLELNGNPQPLTGTAFSDLADELKQTCTLCDQTAAGERARLAMIGILPTLSQKHLTPENMSPLKRYQALDQQLYLQRKGSPVHLNIKGREHLQIEHSNVMLESATTSFQIHLKVNIDQGSRFYNASKILSAPMVALSANSPYLFGTDLWDETRIPLFEQSVWAKENEFSKRVSFGIRYARTILECFVANLYRYSILLPRIIDQPEAPLPHLRLHNGTIWRWNRPLIGFNRQGKPHLRIEHRVVPSGPTVADSIATAAFYYGAVYMLANQPEPPERHIPFQQARENFYNAAKTSLDTQVQWLDGKRVPMLELCRELLSIARRGLEELEVEQHEIDHWLGIIKGRLQTKRNGAIWQRAWTAKHGRNMQGLTEAYLKRQQADRPIYEWDI